MEKFLDIGSSFLMCEEHFGGHHDAGDFDDEARDAEFEAHHDHFADLQVAGHRDHELAYFCKLKGGGLRDGAALAD
jgi:hypothetical protein